MGDFLLGLAVGVALGGFGMWGFFVFNWLVKEEPPFYKAQEIKGAFHKPHAQSKPRVIVQTDEKAAEIEKRREEEKGW